MKPYKIIRPEKPLWKVNTIEVSISENKRIKLPLKLITKCHPFKVSKTVKVVYEQNGNKDVV